MPLDKIAEQEFLEGCALFEQRQYSDAHRIFSSLVRRYSTEGQFHFWLGWTLSQLGEKARAQEAMEMSAGLSSALPQNPYLIIATWVGGYCSDARRRPWLDRGLDWAIASRQPFMIAEARAGLARLGNDKTGARQYLEEALSYAPDKSDTLSELSRVLVELGQYEAAQEVLRNAQERGIVSFTLSSDLGWALIKLNRKKEAATVIREAIDGPDVLAIKKSLQFNWAAHWLSRYYFRHGRFRDLWAISMRQVDLEEELTAQKKAFQQRI